MGRNWQGTQKKKQGPGGKRKKVPERGEGLRITWGGDLGMGKKSRGVVREEDKGTLTSGDGTTTGERTQKSRFM